MNIEHVIDTSCIVCTTKLVHEMLRVKIFYPKLKVSLARRGITTQNKKHRINENDKRRQSNRVEAYYIIFHTQVNNERHEAIRKRRKQCKIYHLCDLFWGLGVWDEETLIVYTS